MESINAQKTHRFEKITISKVKPNYQEIREGIDTGVSDGSGSFTVSAESASKKSNSVVFSNVEVVVSNCKENEMGYADWDLISIQQEAQNMLSADYCK